MKNKPVIHLPIQKITEGKTTHVHDAVIVEEPLEIQLAYSTTNGRMVKNIAVTMRTPGNDDELAAGFLYTEAIIKDELSIQQITHVAGDDNRILVTLKEGILPDIEKVNRHFFASSSCGICGKASIDAIHIPIAFQKKDEQLLIGTNTLNNLQDILKREQHLFAETGGNHACALFDAEGKLILIREDVGRHNALDKLIGAGLLTHQLPYHQHILLLSGRAGFEMIQKAAMAGIKIIVAVGAPSSLAIEMATDAGITLIGFLRNNRFNIYCGEQRVNIN